jgi:hypothetical protein
MVKERLIPDLASFPGISPATLALQLPTCFEVRPLSGGLVSSAPERPCGDVCGLDPLSSEPDGDAPDFLD